MLFVDPKGGEDKHGRTRAVKLAADFDQLRIPYETTALRSGDVMFMGNGPEDQPISVGIELKTVSDFIGSMHSGRLALQVEEMRNTYGFSWIVVEGFYRAGANSGVAEVPCGPAWRQLHLGSRPVFWRDIELFITSLEVQGGVHVRRTRTERETASVIGLVMFPWWSKSWAEHHSLKQTADPQAQRLTLQEEKDPVVRRMHRIARGLDGIGYERGLKVAKSGVFASVKQMINGSADEWQQALGVVKGKRHADQITAAINESVESTATAPTRHQRRR